MGSPDPDVKFFLNLLFRLSPFCVAHSALCVRKKLKRKCFFFYFPPPCFVALVPPSRAGGRIKNVRSLPLDQYSASSLCSCGPSSLGCKIRNEFPSWTIPARTPPFLGTPTLSSRRRTASFSRYKPLSFPQVPVLLFIPSTDRRFFLLSGHPVIPSFLGRAGIELFFLRPPLIVPASQISPLLI